MKKILVIKGYSRENGFTKRLTEYFVSMFTDSETEFFDAFKTNFAFCDGCNFCEENEKCKYNDLDFFKEKFENADVIIFASPLYNGFFSSPLKALLDRLQVYYTYFYKHGKISLVNKKRKVILISSSGRSGKEGFLYMEKSLKYVCSVTNCEYIGGVLCDNTDTAPDIDKSENEIKQLFEKGDFI